MRYYKKCVLCLTIVAYLLTINACSYNTVVTYNEFSQIKGELYNIARLSLQLYRSETEGRIIFVGPNDVLGVISGQQQYFNVDEELASLLTELYNASLPFKIECIIIGDSFVTFTSEVNPYAIMYSEDDVKPTGAWKYDTDDLIVKKFDRYWYELAD